MTSKSSAVSRGGSAIRRVPGAEAFWRRAIARQRASGLTQAAYCEREGLARSTFALWSTRLRDSDRPAGRGTDAAQFIDCTPLVAQAHIEATQSSGLHIRLYLGEGLVLELRRG